MTLPWLSVLMPTYNGTAYLGAALDSVVAEDDPDIECIAVDDGSTDDTIAILERYRDRLNLTIERRPRIGDWVANTNVALDAAAGEFTSLLHQDDIWLPGRLAALKLAIEASPTIDLFLHSSWFIDSLGSRLGPWHCPLPKAAILDAAAVLPGLLVQNFIAIPSPVFRTATARGIGGLDEVLWNTADWDFWLKLASAGRTLCLPETLACFRVHPEAQTNRRSIDIADFRRQHELVLERHLPMLDDDQIRRRTRRRAELSIAVNVTLASRYHGMNPGLAPVMAALGRAGPLGLWRYLRFSRIWERVSARLKAQRRAGRPDPVVGNDAVA